MSQQAGILDIQVVSDVVCPWCYIGKRQLEQALAQWHRTHPDGPAPNVHWRPFQLNPDLPAQGMSRPDYLERKFGSRDGGTIYQHVREAAQREGLTLAFEQIARQPNTRSAHALIEAAAPLGRQDALVEGLFEAYFIAGANLCESEVLREITIKAGIDPGTAAQVLDAGLGFEQVDANEKTARELGISGVPFFIINGRLGVSGAVGAASLEAAFEQACEATANTD